MNENSDICMKHLIFGQEELLIKHGSLCLRPSLLVDSLEGLALLDGSRRLFQQINAQFYKKFLTTIRSWITLSMQMLIPILFVLLSYLIYLNSSTGRDLPELKINLDGYSGSLTVLQTTDGFESVTAAFRDRFRTEPDVHQLIVIDEDMTTFILNKVSIPGFCREVVFTLLMC